MSHYSTIPIMTTYKKADQRREEILCTACYLAGESHYTQIRRKQLAEACGTVGGNITRIMGDMHRLRDDLIDYALRNGRWKVVAQAILNNHAATEHLSAERKSEIMNSAL